MPLFVALSILGAYCCSIASASAAGPPLATRPVPLDSRTVTTQPLTVTAPGGLVTTQPLTVVAPLRKR